MTDSIFSPLPNSKYDILYADPPWDYKGQRQHNGKGDDTGGADKHYPTATLLDLIKLPVWKICKPDCMLFMWTSSPHLPQALRLAGEWGFDYSTVAFVWDKAKTNPGNYTLSRCEICLVFKRTGGRIPVPRGSRREQQFISAPRTKHSEKPNEVRDRIGRMFPSQRRIELFARKRHSGWDSWGNEC